MLASGTQDRGFAPDRSRRIFPAGKIHSMQYETTQTTIEKSYTRTMKHKIRQKKIPVLPWKFFLEGEDSHGDHGLGSLVELRFKAPPGTSYSHITTHLMDLRSRLHFGHNREGRPWSP
jgi:hypothetical protein